MDARYATAEQPPNQRSPTCPPPLLPRSKRTETAVNMPVSFVVRTIYRTVRPSYTSVEIFPSTNPRKVAGRFTRGARTRVPAQIKLLSDTQACIHTSLAAQIRLYLPSTLS